MTALRNLAVREGHIHPAFHKQAELLGKFGKLFEIEDFDNKKRQRSGLPALEKRNVDIAALFRHCGLSHLLGEGEGGGKS
jgi:heterodisulfide reductase subunit C